MIDNCFHHHHHSAVVETFTNQIDNCLKSELVQMRSAWSFRSNWNSWNFITVISNTIFIFSNNIIVIIILIFIIIALSRKNGSCKDITITNSLYVCFCVCMCLCVFARTSKKTASTWVCVPAFDKQEMLHKISLDRNVGQEQALYRLGHSFWERNNNLILRRIVTLRNIENEWCQCQTKVKSATLWHRILF